MRPQYIDIHSHTYFPEFDADRKEVMERALSAGVWMINIGTTSDYSKKAVEMTREYPTGVFAVVGMHPTDASKEVFDKEFFKKLIVEGGKKVVGIGECGLDYFRQTTVEEHEKQREVFISQIELALEFDLPLILHVRNAYKDVLDILKSYKEKYGEKLRGDVHFFAGTVEEAKEFLALGFYLSYTGVVTFAKQYIELVKATPLDRIMSETDCPYVAPAPMRGKRNEPFFVIYTADKERQNHIFMEAEKSKFLIRELQELLSLKRQIVRKMPDIVQSVESEELKGALGVHAAEITKNIERLSESLRLLGLDQGKIDEITYSAAHPTCLDCMRASVAPVTIRDLSLIVSLRRMKHHAFVTCYSLRRIALSLGKNRVYTLLTLIGKSETNTDESLDKISQFILEPVTP